MFFSRSYPIFIMLSIRLCSWIENSALKDLYGTYLFIVLLSECVTV